MMNTHRLLIGISVVGALSLLTVRGLDAHKGITSNTPTTTTFFRFSATSAVDAMWMAAQRRCRS